MSVLETPRLYFRGRVAWDPIVTNNSPDFYDEENARLVVTSGADAAAFRAAAVAAVAGGGVWNPHGTHRSTFYDTIVCGADSGGPQAGGDPLVTAPVGFIGMLVDAEPYGVMSSQLFFDALTFGISGGCRIFAPRTSRFTARYINFGRNLGYRYVAGGAGVIWQTSFAKEDGLRIDVHDSPTLAAIDKALNGDADVLGVTVRWTAYRTWYYDTLDPRQVPLRAHELTQKMQGGGFQPNPARSELVGVLGLWRRGEPAHEPGDRVLLTTGGNRQANPPRNMGTAFARLAGSTLTLDLGNSVAETGVGLKKQNLGALSVVFDGPKGKEVLATIEPEHYDRAAYERQAGIVSVPVDPEIAKRAAGSDLSVRGSDGTVYLSEARYRATSAGPNTYADVGSPPTAQVQVYDRGVPAGAGVPLLVCRTTADGGTVLDAMPPVQTDGNGVATFAPLASQGDVSGYTLLPGPGAKPASISPQLTNYMLVRTLPAGPQAGSDYADPPTWNDVYSMVLVNWHAMAPCMDNWLRLDDEDQVRAYGPLLRRLTDPANFEAFRFMPVTRDMTSGERALLYAFLDEAPAAAAKAPSTRKSLAPRPAAAPPDENPAEIVRQSRKARGPVL